MRNFTFLQKWKTILWFYFLTTKSLYETTMNCRCYQYFREIIYIRMYVLHFVTVYSNKKLCVVYIFPHLLTNSEKILETSFQLFTWSFRGIVWYSMTYFNSICIEYFVVNQCICSQTRMELLYSY